MTPIPTCELWTDWPCVTGASRIGELTVISGTYSDAIDQSDALSLTVNYDARVAPALRYVVMITDTIGVVRGYRISRIGRTHVDSQRTLRGLPAIADLATLGLVRTISGGLANFAVGGRYTPTEFLDNIILTNLSADGGSHWARGTVDPTGYETLTAPAAGWSHLEWLRALRDKTGAELRTRFNGVTSIYIDLITRIGAGAVDVPVAFGKQLLSVQDDQNDGELATAITVLGTTEPGATAPAGIGENAWVIGTATGAGPYWIPLTDPGGSAGPVAFAAQFGTAPGSQAAYLLRQDGGTTQITDSRVTPDTAVQVAATTGLVAGEHVQLVADSSGTRLTELRAPNVKRLHRVDTGGQRGERNMLRNGLFLNWTDAFTPELWTEQGGTFRVGEYSRDLPSTISGVVVNGAHSAGAGGINFRGAVPNSRFFYNEYLVVGGAAFRVSNTVANVDGAGEGSVVFLSGTLPSPVADGATITWLGQDPVRPVSFPTERDANNLMRLLANSGGSTTASALRMQSESITVKYVAGPLAQLNAAAAFTMANGTAGTWDLAVTPGPGIMLRNSTGPAVLAVQYASGTVPVSSTVHQTVSVSATLNADTTVTVCLLGASGTYFNAVRWATHWLGPSTDVPPFPGSWGNGNWQRGNRALVARALSVHQLSVTLHDLSLAAGYSITREMITLGGTITLTDLGLTVRVVSISYPINDRGQIVVTLDSRPTPLVRFLAERI